MQFEYLQVQTAMSSIDIDDIGNCCLQCFSDFGETKVLIIKTIDGISEIITYGPINIDVKELPDYVDYTYQRMEYNQRKIAKIIDKFINDKIVTQVIEIEPVEAKSIIRNLVDDVITDKTQDYDRLI